MKNRFRLRPVVTEWARALYVGAPLSVGLKLRLKSALFALFSPLLRHTEAYRAWRSFEGHGQGLALGMIGAVPASGTAVPTSQRLGIIDFVAEQYGSETGNILQGILDAYGIDRDAVASRSFPPVADQQAAAWIERINARSRALAWDPAPVASVIIPIFNQAQHTLACVESVLAWGAEAPFEIIVSDDCSTDLALRHILDALEGVRVIRPPENLGFLRNCNQAAGQALGRYIVFLNNDTLVLPGWLDQLLATFDAFPDAGIVGSKFLYPDGSVQEAGGIIWSDATACNYGRTRHPRSADLNYVRRTDYISGAAIVLPAALFRELGGFDERYAPAYCEDSDLAFQVRERGFQVYLQPASEVIHFESVSSGMDMTSGAKRHQEINIVKLIERWDSVLKREQFDRNQYFFLARDRSANDAHLLLIDQNIPRFDRDAGSRTIYQYARLFASRGIRVSFWPDDRAYDPFYARALQSVGVEVLYGGYGLPEFDEWIRQNGLFFDYVLLSRPEVARKYTRLVREHSSARVLYYGHDLHHARFARELAVNTSAGVRQREKESRLQELAVWKEADVVLYPSEEERHVVEAMVPGPTVRSIPAFYFEGEPAAIDASNRSGLLFVGGFKHSPNVDGLRWFFSSVWPRLQQLAPGTVLSIVGSDAPDDLAALASGQIRFLGYLRDAELSQVYRASAVSVAPLRVGAGVKGKVVESLWHGLPVATTSTGAQGLLGAEAFLMPADDPEQFAARIAALLRDTEAWAITAHAGQDYVRHHFSVPAVVAKLRDVIPELADTDRC
jgi:O-antigen biosynthesis protein